MGRGADPSPGPSFLTCVVSSGNSNPHPGRVCAQGSGTVDAQQTLETFCFTKRTWLGKRKLQETPRFVHVAKDTCAHLWATALAGLPSVLGSFRGRHALGNRGPGPCRPVLPARMSRRSTAYSRSPNDATDGHQEHPGAPAAPVGVKKMPATPRQEAVASAGLPTPTSSGAWLYFSFRAPKIKRMLFVLLV